MTPLRPTPSGAADRGRIGGSALQQDQPARADAAAIIEDDLATCADGHAAGHRRDHAGLEADIAVDRVDRRRPNSAPDCSST